MYILLQIDERCHIIQVIQVIRKGVLMDKQMETKQTNAFPLRFKTKNLKIASDVLAAKQAKSLTQLINELLEREVKNDDIAKQVLAGAGR